ncbi:hypothetical protein Pan216_22910 [Planctomycetes bacterium Pan216]|uniref:DUF5060 domain-containing protein n=1 Tax=Kolteria novifilia TaxID=2527975 RepID=A0A518B3B4_9BACT|nr:hypothetical protein Pan216_22910 [Planctomycetes bacterium Pan216]
MLRLLVVSLMVVTVGTPLELHADESSPSSKNERPKPGGDGSIVVSGDQRQWHKLTLSMSGPQADELDNDPNPFTDYRFTVRFTHESGSPAYTVPGYFAADGDAANTGATSGTTWRAHLSPDKPGRWSYATSMRRGKNVAINSSAKSMELPAYAKRGQFTIAPTDKTGRDFRAKGRLEYVGKHYQRFAGNGEYFLKAGPDAPETLLATIDFDGTRANKGQVPLKRWAPHVKDWRPGDPTWKDGKGKGLLGAINYLAAKGCNTISFLPYNAGGDGDNVWPFVSRDDKFHYDCSKLAQWQIVFDHANNRGMHLHFKLQETEMDDNRHGKNSRTKSTPTALDDGRLGPERKLYLRELIARFAHELALVWNIGEENTQTPAEQRDMIRYLHDTDPYRHNIAIHTFPNQQDKVYPPLLGSKSLLTGASLQNNWNAAHQRTLKWVRESARANRPWVVCNDEQGPAAHGVPPDRGYRGHDGLAGEKKTYDLHDIRKLTLWGTLMAGGAGVEYYFGYKLPENDLLLEDFRSRDQTWDYCRVALAFFKDHAIPFWEMTSADALIGNSKSTNSRFCFAKPGELYLVYFPTVESTKLDLSDAAGTFTVRWFDPRHGGPLATGSVTEVTGGKAVSLGTPPSAPKEDWLAVLRRQ